MKSVLVKNGRLMVDTKNEHILDGDILVKNGVIEEISDHIDENKAQTVIDAQKNFVSPGFIDIHTHCYPIGKLGMDPDTLGVQRWSSTIFDAGTAGPETFEDFKATYIDKAKTKVFSLLNLSKRGIEVGHELDSVDKLDPDGVRRLVKQYPDTIVGLKARASQSVVGKMGITPIRMTADLAHELGIPVLVHIGHYPPALTDVLDCLQKGDSITHAYHGKPGGLIQNGQILPEAIAARKRGVKFDVGHGEESFCFSTYQKALKLGFDCDTISSDLHKRNYNGPVYSNVLCVSKLINCGETLSLAVDKVTRAPAENFHLKKLGVLKKGYIGDVFIFRYADCNEDVLDSMGNKLHMYKKIEPMNLIISRGEESEVL